ncbi:phage holin family protein [Brevibacillus ginsengisoli]|uniref:phage holin family protein n=1 Tax=Brevibacillus ginsengisoli TaxID=363854 RepID=UPI003CF3C7DC
MERFAKAILSLETLGKPSNGLAALIGATIAPFLDTAVQSGKFWAYLFMASIIAGDWLAGTSAAKKNETYASEYGLAGVFRTLLLGWIPIIGFLLDKVTFMVFQVAQPGIFYYALTLGIAYHSWESMTANAYRAGWKRWIPKKIVDYVSSEIKAKAERSLRQKGDK